MASKPDVKKIGQGRNPQKAYRHPLRDSCMQHENNTANALWDIVWKLNLSSASKKLGQKS